MQIIFSSSLLSLTGASLLSIASASQNFLRGNFNEDVVVVAEEHRQLDPACPDLPLDICVTQDAVGCNCVVSPKMSAASIQGCFNAPVGSDHYYCIEYLVDIMDYGNGNLLALKPETHKKTFYYAVTSGVAPTPAPRIVGQCNLEGTGIKAFHLDTFSTGAGITCNWKIGNGSNQPPENYGTVTFDRSFIPPTFQAGQQVPTATWDDNPENKKGGWKIKKTIDHEGDTIVWTWSVGDYVKYRNGSSHAACVDPKCSDYATGSILKINGSPVDTSEWSISCPGLPNTVTVRNCGEKFHVDCTLDVGGNTFPFTI